MRTAVFAGLALCVVWPSVAGSQSVDTGAAADILAPPAGAGAQPVALELPQIGPNEFLVHPPGVLQDPKAKGVAEYKGYAPGMRFPIGTYPAYANSQIFGAGGTNGPTGNQCDDANFKPEWWDNFCETRGFNVPLCPSGKGHQGVDLRAGSPVLCKLMQAGQKNLVPVVAVYSGTIKKADPGSLILETSGYGDFVYLQMDLAPEITGVSQGSSVKAGQVIGYLSNLMQGKPVTTFHLHFEHRMTIDGRGRVSVPVYCDLVLAYERDKGYRAIMVDGGQRCGEAGFSITVPADILTTIQPGAEITLNGIKRSVMEVKPADKSIMLTGTEDALLDGLNSLKKDLVADGAIYRFFKEKGGQTVEPFADPYGPSHAVIAAIDDYDRVNDPEKRGPTGYRSLTGMVASAEKLKSELIRHGFKLENIVTLHNEKATSRAIEDALAEFHAGGAAENADRVLFYFGGHGDGKDGNGHLVTYDYEPRRPTRTSFPMSRFVSEQFPFIKAKHMLVALDTCSSGMALQGMFTLDKEKTEADLKSEIVRLATLEGETRDRARNMIVAGTGDQKALWEEEGGLFTKALVDALSGQADFIGDGIIQFDELSLYVTRAVREAAKRRGLQQDPRAFVATGFGQGKVLFLSPERQ